MDCPNCNNLNPEGARFCQSCGHSLEAPCPNCGTSNSLAARFCQNCGSGLTGENASLEIPVESVHAPGPVESERRIVTILFADVKGSTAIAEQLDPEEWTEIMNGAFERLIPAITLFDGNVIRLMGDAVLALFGAPIAHEDDPYRAVLAALSMINDLRPYQDRIRGRLIKAGLTPDPTDFAVRIGINTGLVVVGRVGSDQSGEYTAMGDAVNIASRMEQTAEPGTIQIAQDTYRHVASFVQTEPLGEVKFKGKSEPLLTYEVLGLRADIGELRNVSGLAAPLIGRDDEMDILRRSLNQIQQGSGQIACLIGEAGLGKSRLIQELKLETSDIPLIEWYETISLSFETSQPYGLLLRLLRRVCACTQNDSPERIRKRITQLIQELPEELQTQMNSVLGSLFSLEMENGQQPLSGEELKRELFAAMGAFWRYQAAGHPLVLVLDDLHWADAASVELVRHLFAIVEDAPIFFLCVFRPERHSPAWSLKQLAENDYHHRYHELWLSPLKAHESDALIENLLQAPDLAKEARDLILKKAEGNPLFVQEIVWEMIESEAVLPTDNGKGWRLASDIEEIDVPDSLEAVLVARIDRLQENTRHTLQLAAVIGRSFYYRVLDLIATNIDRLDQHLLTLQQVGLIQEAARIPELEYMFRHVLTQEAAYNTILLKRRRHFHQRTGEIIEQLFADRLDEHASLLAHHFLRSGDHVRSLKYLIRAGDNASRLHAHKEAIDHFSKAIDIEDGMPLSVEDKILLHRGRGMAYEMMGMFDQALADLEVVLETAEDSERMREIWRALLDLGKLWAARSYQESEKYFLQALEIARKLDDPVALGRSLNRLGNWYVNAERPREGIQYHQEAKAIFDSLDDSRGLADTLDFLGMASLLGGDPAACKTYYTDAIIQFEAMGDRAGLVSSLTARAYSAPIYQTQAAQPAATLMEAVVDGERALQMSREIGWRAGESFACWSLAQVYGVMGRLGEAIEAAQIGLAIAVEINHLQWMSGSYGSLGYLYLDLLEWELAKEKFELALLHAEEVDSQNFISVSSGPLAQALILMGDLKQARAYLAPVLLPKTPMISIGQRLMWKARAELALVEGDIASALQIVDRLVSLGVSIPADGIMSTVWHLRARIMLATGKHAEAERLLLAAIENAQYFGEKSLLWKLYGTLLQVYRIQSRVQESSMTLLLAQGVIDDVTSTLPEETMRNNFAQRANSHLEER
jgi:predicted ATPase/class 3 adenylate cyclase